MVLWVWVEVRLQKLFFFRGGFLKFEKKVSLTLRPAHCHPTLIYGELPLLVLHTVGLALNENRIKAQ